MRLLVRVDAGTEVGSWHIMRCLLLFVELRKLGVKVLYYAARYLPVVLIRLTGDSDFEIEEIPTEAHADRLLYNLQCSELQSEDLDTTLIASKRICAEFILIDQYGATSDYLMAIRCIGMPLDIIDVMADRNITAMEWLLKQNIGEDNLVYKCRTDYIQLCGPKYALLLQTFSEIRKRISRTCLAKDNRGLITLRGVKMKEWP